MKSKLIIIIICFTVFTFIYLACPFPGGMSPKHNLKRIDFACSFDPETGDVAEITRMPFKGDAITLRGLSVEDYIYVLNTATGSFARYDCLLGVWSILSSVPDGIIKYSDTDYYQYPNEHVALCYDNDGYILYISGNGEPVSEINTCSYVMSNASWVETNEFYYEGKAWPLNIQNKACIIFDNGSVYEYDTSVVSWNNITTCPNEFIICDAYGSFESQYLLCMDNQSTYIYDFLLDNWTSIVERPSYGYDFTTSLSSYTYFNNCLYMMYWNYVEIRDYPEYIYISKYDFDNTNWTLVYTELVNNYRSKMNPIIIALGENAYSYPYSYCGAYLSGSISYSGLIYKIDMFEEIEKSIDESGILYATEYVETGIADIFRIRNGELLYYMGGSHE